jgi:DNA (cytosine-5)-methyltransferase 1
MPAPLKTGHWRLTDLADVPKNGLKVFSCFHCGGGSTMGYKLAGYDVLGGVEIDPEMMALYRKNHSPKHSYLMGVEAFNKIPDSELPAELFELDILDGSPPCSSFSTAGAREKKWNTKTKFREGQAVQVLDDLFFHFIDTARKLKPKVVVAENVKGLILGNAKGYVKQIFAAFRKAGYDCQLFLLNASRMGVPQRRKRTVFIARRSDLNLPKIKLEFYEPEISVLQAFRGITTKGKDRSQSPNLKYYQQCKPGESFSKYHPKGSLFNYSKLSINSPASTIVGSSHCLMHFESMRQLSKDEFFALQTFPQDYAVQTDKMAGYICGMSVPPFMMQRIADQIERQWLGEIGHP